MRRYLCPSWRAPRQWSRPNGLPLVLNSEAGFEGCRFSHSSRADRSGPRARSRTTGIGHQGCAAGLRAWPPGNSRAGRQPQWSKRAEALPGLSIWFSIRSARRVPNSRDLSLRGRSPLGDKQVLKRRGRLDDSSEFARPGSTARRTCCDRIVRSSRKRDAAVGLAGSMRSACIPLNGRLARRSSHLAGGGFIGTGGARDGLQNAIPRRHAPL